MDEPAIAEKQMKAKISYLASNREVNGKAKAPSARPAVCVHALFFLRAEARHRVALRSVRMEGTGTLQSQDLNFFSLEFP